MRFENRLEFNGPRRRPKNRNSEKSKGGLRDPPSGIELVGPNLRSKDSSRPLGETQGSLELLAGVRDLVVSPVEVVRTDNNDLALRREKSTSLRFFGRCLSFLLTPAGSPQMESENRPEFTLPRRRTERQNNDIPTKRRVRAAGTTRPADATTSETQEHLLNNWGCWVRPTQESVLG